MKILITGGGGFIGRNLARLLPIYGHTVLAPTRQELDMTNLHMYQQYLGYNVPDAIIHTAFKGHFSAAKSEGDFLANLQMFENLLFSDAYDRATIVFGSGSEFDRRFVIDKVNEPDVFREWPIDLYGLSKNIITRRLLEGKLQDDMEISNPYLLRLFGCFGPDEPDFRFIKRSITRLKQGLPIEIHQDKFMDFFYIDDVAAVVNEVVTKQHDTMAHMNLVYSEKVTLSQIAKTICKCMNVPENIVVKFKGDGGAYTGNGIRLKTHNIDLYGLEQGIARMVKDLA